MKILDTIAAAAGRPRTGRAVRHAFSAALLITTVAWFWAPLATVIGPFTAVTGSTSITRTSSPSHS